MQKKETRDKRYDRKRVKKQVFFSRTDIEIELYLKADKIPNFSEWVKSELRKELKGHKGEI